MPAVPLASLETSMTRSHLAPLYESLGRCSFCGDREAVTIAGDDELCAPCANEREELEHYGDIDPREPDDAHDPATWPEGR